MKKEITIVVTIALYFLSATLDYFAGPLKISIYSPKAFLAHNYFATYPLTFVAVFMRALAILLTVILILSVLERRYFTKIGVALFLGFVAEFYAIQQLATGMRFTPILWTLSIAYAAVGLAIPIIGYIFLGIASFFKPKEQEMTERTEPEEVGKAEEHGDSVLEPPKE